MPRGSAAFDIPFGMMDDGRGAIDARPPAMLGRPARHHPARAALRRRRLRAHRVARAHARPPVGRARVRRPERLAHRHGWKSAAAAGRALRIAGVGEGARARGSRGEALRPAAFDHLLLSRVSSTASRVSRRSPRKRSADHASFQTARRNFRALPPRRAGVGGRRAVAAAPHRRARPRNLRQHYWRRWTPRSGPHCLWRRGGAAARAGAERDAVAPRAGRRARARGRAAGRPGRARRVCVWDRLPRTSTACGRARVPAGGGVRRRREGRADGDAVPRDAPAARAHAARALLAGRRAAPRGGGARRRGRGGAAVADSPPTDATAAILAAQAALAAERTEGSGGSDKPGGPSKEEELVQQISGMISGLISELEGQAGAPPRNESVASDGGGGPGDGAEHGDGDEDGPPQGTPPPVHFRVYRSSGFPGLPPGIGGLPFGLPGGPGGDEEEGEVATLERRLKAAALPAEAEEVASRELKRLRRHVADALRVSRRLPPPARPPAARAPAAPRRRPASRRPADAPPPPAPCRYSTLVDYLEWIVDLPWNTSSAERLQLTEARAKLEERRRTPRILSPRSSASTGAREARGGPLRDGEGEGADPRVPLGVQAQGRHARLDPLHARPAGDRQDLARQVDRHLAQPFVLPRLPRRRAHRGRGARPPPHLRRRDAGADPAGDQEVRRQQLRDHAR